MESRADLLELSRGYWQSRTLLTAVELGVFESIGRRRRTAGEVARAAGADVRAIGLLLDALCGLGILAKSDGRYAIRRPVLELFTEGEASALGMLRHHARLWATWSQLTECVREGRAAETEGGFRGGPEAARAFTVAMREGARLAAPVVAQEVELAGRRRLLDLGGGPGVYAAAFARRHPTLEVVVVDLPDVCAVGAEMVAAEEDVAPRISYHPADLHRDPLPKGADAAFLSHVIHSEAEAEVKALFGRLRSALEPDGVLVVRDFFTAPDGTTPAGASLFSLNMLVNTEAGRSYSARETATWLRKAGFASARFRRSTSIPDTGYLLARVPKRAR